MLSLQFLGQNLHFTISLLAMLVSFAVFWLYFDAWSGNRSLKEALKWGGFLFISLSFLVHSTTIEQTVLGSSLMGEASEAVGVVLRLVGYLLLIWGQIIDPLMPKPEMEGLGLGGEPREGASGIEVSKPEAVIPDKPGMPAVLPVLSVGSKLALPMSSFTIALLYFRRATTGLERHLRPVAISFGFLALSDMLSLATTLRGSSNVLIHDLMAPFGVVWTLEHVLLALYSIVLGRWVWRYLTKRFQSQLFMIFTSFTMLAFLITTLSFTFLLIRNIQNESLNNLKTATSVLGYAIDGKKTETMSGAEVVAQDPAVQQAVAARDHAKLTSLTSNYLELKKQSSLVITSDSGQVLLRAEDPSRYGDSISSDTLVRRALIGEASSSVTAKEDVIAPLIYIRTATPIRDSGSKIIGVAIAGIVADNSFVDGIKHSTGLDSAIYAGNVRSATTFLSPDGKSRLVGIKENHSVVKSTVLKKGKTYEGALSISNRSYLAVYAPLKDVDNVPVGMLFIGKPQASILLIAGHSIELTFILAAVLILLAVAPAYYISRYLARQLR
jgi:hypothetical protein